MPAIPVLMVQYENEAVDVRYSDGSRLQLSPCGASFCHWDPPDTQLHPLHGVRCIQQRSQFSLSRFRTKVLAALDFRNRFAHQPYLCQELLSPEAVVYLHSNITHIAWANTLQESDIDIQPDGTIKLTSEDEYATLVLSKHGRDFTVCYLSKISRFPSKNLMVYNRKNPTSSPITVCDSGISPPYAGNSERIGHDVDECITDTNNSNNASDVNVANEMHQNDGTGEQRPELIDTQSQCVNSHSEHMRRDDMYNINNDITGDLPKLHHINVQDNLYVTDPGKFYDASPVSESGRVLLDKGLLVHSNPKTDSVDPEAIDKPVGKLEGNDGTLGHLEEPKNSFQISSTSAFLPISAGRGRYMYTCSGDSGNVTDCDDLDASEVASNTSYAELKITTRDTPPSCSMSKHVSFSVPLKETHTVPSSFDAVSHPSNVIDSADYRHQDYQQTCQFVDNLDGDNQTRNVICPIPLHSTKNPNQIHNCIKLHDEKTEHNTEVLANELIDIAQSKQIIQGNYDTVKSQEEPLLRHDDHHESLLLNSTSAECGPQTAAHRTHSQTTNRSLELSPIGCISSNRKPGYITEDALQSERESQSGYHYTWVTWHVSCSDCPAEWYHPSCLLQQAFEHYHSEQEEVTARMAEKRSQKESKPNVIRNLPRKIDIDKCVLCSVAEPVPLSCAGQHLHRWHSCGAGGDDASVPGPPAGRMNVIMSEGVIFRLIRVSSLKLVEVYPGDGSVIFSQGMTGHYFSHLIPHDTELEEKSYSLNHLPPDYPGCPYSIEKLVRRAARYFEQMLQEDSHLIHVEDKCCWKYSATPASLEPAPMKLTEECVVPGVGRFTANSNGRIRVVFCDRTALDMTMSVQSRRRTGSLLDDIPTGHCRLLLPNAQYVVVDMQKPAPYECYVDPAVQWMGWVSATTEQRKQIYSKHVQNIDQKMSVTRELKKINCFNYIMDKTVVSHNTSQVTSENVQPCTKDKNSSCGIQPQHTQNRRTGNKALKHVQFQSTRFADCDNKNVSLQNISDFDDVRLALQRTSNIIKDIDSILTLKK